MWRLMRDPQDDRGHIDAANDLQDGVDVAAMPPMGPDGHPQLSPNADLPPDPPRLCAAGPCRHYHTFKIQLDAANPMNTDRDGTSFHTNVHHYCYPSPGVETNLGSLPVLDCSRWAPATLIERGVFARGELALRKLLVRRAFDADLRAFQQQRDAVMSDLEEAARVPEVDEALGITVEVMLAGLGQSVDFTVTADTTIAAASSRAVELATSLEVPPGGFATAAYQWFTSADLTEQYEPIENVEATFAQLGIRHGSRLRVVILSKENETP